MNKNLKILCVCQKGCSRSVGTVYRLNRRGFGNAIAVGYQVANLDTLRMLAAWADVILLAEPFMLDAIPEFKDKVESHFTIGRDRWGYFRNSEMQEIIKRQLNGIGLR